MPAQREIYDIVLESLETSLRLFRPRHLYSGGDRRSRAHHDNRAGEAGDLGKGEVDQLIAENAHRPFLYVRLEPLAGADVRDVGVVSDSRTPEPGMVLTVEPCLHSRAGCRRAGSAGRGIGTELKMTLSLAETGVYENLTAGVVKKADDIEALMAAARQQ